MHTQRTSTSVFCLFWVLEIECEIISAFRLLSHATEAVDDLLSYVRPNTDYHQCNSDTVSLVALVEQLDLTDQGTDLTRSH